MSLDRKDIRIALPSKGRLAEQSLQFLSDAGLRVYKPNPRQYQASIPAFPEMTVIFQRPGDIVVGVRQGSVDFGITGWDMFAERRGEQEVAGSNVAMILACLATLGVRIDIAARSIS